jgi:histidine triad (HIT) family protein
VKGEAPAKKVYENEKVLAFLTIGPISRGHLLVIPKKHFENIFDIDEDYLKEIIFATKKISQKLKKNLKADGVNILHASGKDAQQSVFHFHLHLVPRYKNDGIDTWPKSNYQELNFEEVTNKIKE